MSWWQACPCEVQFWGSSHSRMSTASSALVGHCRCLRFAVPFVRWSWQVANIPGTARATATVCQNGGVWNMPDLVWDSLDYFGILIALYATTVAIYFILGYSLTWLNGRNPERKIQRNRGSGKRR